MVVKNHASRKGNPWQTNTKVKGKNKSHRPGSLEGERANATHVTVLINPDATYYSGKNWCPSVRKKHHQVVIVKKSR